MARSGSGHLRRKPNRSSNPSYLFLIRMRSASCPAWPQTTCGFGTKTRAKERARSGRGSWVPFVGGNVPDRPSHSSTLGLCDRAPSVASTQRLIEVRGASREDSNSHYRFHIDVVDGDPRYGVAFDQEEPSYLDRSEWQKQFHVHLGKTIATIIVKRGSENK
jgi:hypothetical protein